MSIEIIRRLNDYGRRLLRLESQERRQTFGRDVLGPVDYVHFQDTTIPTGYSWAGSPFATPGAGQVEFGNKGDYLVASSVGALAFMYRSVSVYLGRSISARVVMANGGDIGIRIDDGTDNNYSELNLYHVGATNVTEARCRTRSGGGAVTTLHSSSFGDGEIPRVITIIATNNAGQHIDNFGFINEAGGGLLVAASLSAAWSVTRAGLIFKRDSGVDIAYCDWLYTDMT
jgi:hypothetical protein